MTSNTCVGVVALGYSLLQLCGTLSLLYKLRLKLLYGSLQLHNLFLNGLFLAQFSIMSFFLVLPYSIYLYLFSRIRARRERER